MNRDFDPLEALELQNTGISLVTWLPQEPHRMSWVYINEARCRMTGQQKRQILATPPFAGISRETRAVIEGVNEKIAAEGKCIVESTLVHASHQPLPVMLHMTLIPCDDGDLLLTEYHDIGAFKETEAELSRARDRSDHIMNLLSAEKQQLVNNIQENLGLIVLPLIDQLWTTATPAQKEILDILENRLRDITRDLGIDAESELAAASLTRRQILICEMIREGLSSKSIAAALDCSPSTINNHRNEIRRKLGLAGKSINLQAYLNRMSGFDETHSRE